MYGFKYGKGSLQQKWAMVTKSSEDKQFHHQMITFSEEKKNSSPNIIKNLKKSNIVRGFNFIIIIIIIIITIIG